MFIRGVKELQPFTYHSPVDSAQVKSAMILAALRANGISKYKENELTRDHTERMLNGMGAKIEYDNEGFINIHPLTAHLKPLNITVPTDPSSGFFFCSCSCHYKNAIRVVIKNVNIKSYKNRSLSGFKKNGCYCKFY